MNVIHFRSRESRKPCILLLTLALTLTTAAFRAAPVTRAGPASAVSAAPDLKGRIVEDVQIVGNYVVSSTVIRKLIRTEIGRPLDPATVEEDYQRIYNELKKFSNVEARVEPTRTGVIVTFQVTEQKQIRNITFKGNKRVDNDTLKAVVDILPGQAIDTFKIALARGAIESLYRDRNFPFAHVEVPTEQLTRNGDLIFNVVEGPNVRIRKVDFKGGRSFTKDKLKDQIKTSSWIFIFRPGKLDREQLDEDVAALRRFYENHGFFDVRVGRKVIVSPDLGEVQVNFVIDEGPRYTVDQITFEGNTSLSDQDLRKRLKLVEGRTFDEDLIQRDVRELVRAYSPFGFIYQQPGTQSQDPDYFRIEPKHVFRTERGKVHLVYEIHEGKPFRVGRIIVKGNSKSQDKLVLREMRFGPGQLFNSGELQDATERLRATGFFSSVNVTPIGDAPDHRDLIVELTEARTATFNVGAGVNSNGGLGGNLTYEQHNFDAANFPPDGDIFSDRAFTGAGQTFRASFEPGTKQTNAGIRFAEPWLFDQPYSFSNDVYLRNRVREHYDDQRIGDRVTFGKRFNYQWSALMFLRGESVKINHIDLPASRAPEILAARGSSVLTSVGLSLRRDTTNPGVLPYQGSVASAGVEAYGLLGGDYHFQKFTLGWDFYQTLHEDLTDRKTVLGLHANAGYITGDSVFFERFYGGGIGNVRGFQYRGISPRGGKAQDPIGGDFSLNGTVELGFPLVGENIRGVVFSDAGTVERDVRISTMRLSIGAGIRLVLPFLGQTPLALDFAVPLVRDSQDEEQLISFSFGFIQ